MRLVLPDIPRSPNGPKGLLRMHWAVRKKYNDYWHGLVRSQMDNSHKPCKQRMAVAISQMRRRKLDPDNLVASCKPLIDALKAWGLIVDDSEKWIELDVRQVTGKEKITVVQIEAIDQQ